MNFNFAFAGDARPFSGVGADIPDEDCVLAVTVSKAEDTTIQKKDSDNFGKPSLRLTLAIDPAEGHQGPLVKVMRYPTGPQDKTYGFWMTLLGLAYGSKNAEQAKQAMAGRNASVDPTALLQGKRLYVSFRRTTREADDGSGERKGYEVSFIFPEEYAKEKEKARLAGRGGQGQGQGQSSGGGGFGFGDGNNGATGPGTPPGDGMENVFGQITGGR